MVLCVVRYAAKDKRTLRTHHITHVLNAADGKFNVNTGASYYRDTKISYHGVEAFDMPSFDLSTFFYSAAKFIKTALSSPNSKQSANQSIKSTNQMYFTRPFLHYQLTKCFTASQPNDLFYHAEGIISDFIFCACFFLYHFL